MKSFYWINWVFKTSLGWERFSNKVILFDEKDVFWQLLVKCWIQNLLENDINMKKFEGSCCTYKCCEELLLTQSDEQDETESSTSGLIFVRMKKWFFKLDGSSQEFTFTWDEKTLLRSNIEFDIHVDFCQSEKKVLFKILLCYLRYDFLLHFHTHTCATS